MNRRAYPTDLSDEQWLLVEQGLRIKPQQV
jgi:hypothetical protein